MAIQSRARRFAGWISTLLVFGLFCGSAVGKLMAAPPVVKMLGEWGLGDFRMLIGVGELVSALLFLIPITHSLGVLLLSGYMGGAIVTHMQHGEPFIAQSVILALIWVVGYIRHPELLQSFREFGSKPAT